MCNFDEVEVRGDPRVGGITIRLPADEPTDRLTCSLQRHLKRHLSRVHATISSVREVIVGEEPATSAFKALLQKEFEKWVPDHLY